MSDFNEPGVEPETFAFAGKHANHKTVTLSSAVERKIHGEVGGENEYGPEDTSNSAF